MKKHERKRIEIFAADGFAPAEIETLQQVLESALEKAGRETTIAVRCLSRIEARPDLGEGDRIEVETTSMEQDSDSFEEALHCVEALQPRR